MVKKESPPKILVTRKIPETGLNLLRATCEVDLYEYNNPIPRELFLKKVKNLDETFGVILTNTHEKKNING